MLRAPVRAQRARLARSEGPAGAGRSCAGKGAAGPPSARGLLRAVSRSPGDLCMLLSKMVSSGEKELCTERSFSLVFSGGGTGPAGGMMQELPFKAACKKSVQRYTGRGREGCRRDSTQTT